MAEQSLNRLRLFHFKSMKQEYNYTLSLHFELSQAVVTVHKITYYFIRAIKELLAVYHQEIKYYLQHFHFQLFWRRLYLPDEKLERT